MNATKVNASYKKIVALHNVLINVPGTNDKHMKYIPEHSIEVEGNAIPIPGYYRRGDIINGEFLTKNFFLTAPPLEKSQKIVADIKVIEKIDHARGDKKTLLLDVQPTKNYLNLSKAEWDISLGSPTGDIEIPGTGRFIAFKKKS